MSLAPLNATFIVISTGMALGEGRAKWWRFRADGWNELYRQSVNGLKVV